MVLLYALAAVPLALFALQYTQIISFVMISPYFVSLSLAFAKNEKKGSFLPQKIGKIKFNPAMFLTLVWKSMHSGRVLSCILFNEKYFDAKITSKIQCNLLILFFRNWLLCTYWILDFFLNKFWNWVSNKGHKIVFDKLHWL